MFNQTPFRPWPLRAALALLMSCCVISPLRAMPPRAQPVMLDAGETALGNRIVAYARAHLGQQVGDGECYDLADEALRHNGGRSAPDFGEITATADYVWGTQVDPRDAMPGDIVQFNGFTVKTTTLQAGTRDWEIDTREHHTSIVERNLGGRLLLLEQNVEPGLVVQRTVVPVASLTMDGSPDGTPGVIATRFEITGVAHVYRPQAASRLFAGD